MCNVRIDLRYIAFGEAIRQVRSLHVAEGKLESLTCHSYKPCVGFYRVSVVSTLSTHSINAFQLFTACVNILQPRTIQYLTW